MQRLDTTLMILDRADAPKGKWGGYRKVAVVEVDTGRLPEGRTEPAMISTNARGVVTIVTLRGGLHAGQSERSAYRIALREAEETIREIETAREKVRRRVASKLVRERVRKRVAAGDPDALVLMDAFMDAGRSERVIQSKRYADGLDLMYAFKKK